MAQNPEFQAFLAWAEKHRLIDGEVSRLIEFCVMDIACMRHSRREPDAIARKFFKRHLDQPEAALAVLAVESHPIEMIDKQ